MLIPVGLGTRPRRVPVATLLIVAAMVLFYLFDNPAGRLNLRSENSLLTDLEQRVVTALGETKLAENLNELFLEYCVAEKVPLERCKLYSAYAVSNSYVAMGKDEFRLFKEFGRPKDYVSSDFNEIAEARRVAFRGIYEMMKAGPNDPLFKDQKVVKRFLFLIKHRKVSLRKLSSYQPYMDELYKAHRNTYRHFLLGDWLTPGSINLRSILTAQFRHASWQSLMANMFVILIFGIYVEMRIGPMLMFLGYFLSGSISLLTQVRLFADAFQPVVGAAGNAYAIMAMFFVLFLNFDLKFRVMPVISRLISKRTTELSMPVGVAVPVLVAGDFIALIGNTSGQALGGYYAHVGGIFCGALLAVLFNKLLRIPYPFISKEEINDYILLRQEENIDVKIRRSRVLLHMNRRNFHVRRHTIKAVVQVKAEAFARRGIGRRNVYTEYVGNELAPLCAQVAEIDTRLAVEVLAAIPVEVPLVEALSDIGQRPLLLIADAALQSGHGLLALRLLDVYLLTYERSCYCPDIMDSVWSILSNLPAEPFALDFLVKYSELSARSAIRDLIGRRRLQVKYAVRVAKQVGLQTEMVSNGKEGSEAS